MTASKLGTIRATKKIIGPAMGILRGSVWMLLCAQTVSKDGRRNFQRNLSAIIDLIVVNVSGADEVANGREEAVLAETA
jgi:hypothetical protein